VVVDEPDDVFVVFHHEMNGSLNPLVSPDEMKGVYGSGSDGFCSGVGSGCESTLPSCNALGCKKSRSDSKGAPN
jgi:hypothetical protein